MESPPLVQEDPALARRYRDYCQRQAKGLASILPKEAIRPLYPRRFGSGTGSSTSMPMSRRSSRRPPLNSAHLLR
jgi:hypothetical protein